MLTCFAQAKCTDAQNSQSIEIKIDKIFGAVKAGGNHGYMDIVKVSAPAKVSGVPIHAMKLTKGEVAEFWVPIAFSIDNDFAYTEVTGYSDSIKGFEISVSYLNEQCQLVAQRSI